MKVPFLAAGLSAACLLSACGFAPPKPPMPADTPRVAVNREDPRLYSRDPAVPPAPLPTEHVAIASRVSPSGSQSPAGKSPSPASAPATKPGQAESMAQATQSPTSLAIPVPVAPAKAEPPPASRLQQAITARDAPPAGLTAKGSPSSSVAATAKPAAAIATAPTGQAEESKPKSPGTAVPVAGPATPKASPGTAAAEALKITSAPITMKQIWHLGPQDKTVRQALARWAKDANWTFGPDQWEVSFDLPIEASADFPATSFEEATQALTNSIALTDSPVRPCFYANKVLRIIPFNQSCDRTTAPMARP